MFDFFSDHEFASPIRRRIVAVIIALVFAGFIARFVQLQILEGAELRGAASAQGIKRIERIPVRGAIYDRYGAIIAASIPAYAVIITPQDFNPRSSSGWGSIFHSFITPLRSERGIHMDIPIRAPICAMSD